MTYCNPYTYDKVKSMSGQDVGRELRKLGIDPKNTTPEGCKQLLIQKGKEMKKEQRAMQITNTNEVTRTDNYNQSIIVKNLADDISSVKELLTNLLEVQKTMNEAIADLYLLCAESFSAKKKTVPTKDEPSEKKNVYRNINDSEVERYVKSLNPLAIANTKTADTYEDFKTWCSERQLIPCTQIKLSKNICREHPFKCVSGYFKVIAK